jgi:Lrp/AsnC family transcriptional regulator, leucine-responsive regulatory protein
LNDFDEVDLRILRELEADAWQSNLKLAARVHVSPATCLRRVNLLRESGVIERVVAILDPSKVSVPLAAIVEVTLDRQAAEMLDAFEVRAIADPDVRECYRVSSGADFVLMIQVADMDQYHAFAHRLLAAETNVRNVRVLFSTRRAKFDTRRLPAS